MPLRSRGQSHTSVRNFCSFSQNEYPEEFVKACRIAGQRLSTRLLVPVALVASAVLVLAYGSKVTGPVPQTVQTPAIAQTPVVPPGATPLSFEPNQGQTDPQVKFLARGSSYELFLTSDEAVLKLQPSSRKTQSAITQAIRMRLLGASPAAELAASGELKAKSNYLMGNDPSRWHTQVPHFARVKYDQVYPGIDLVYYGNQGRLEYDFNVAPGADPKAIALSFTGQEYLAVDRSGDLLIQTAHGTVRFQSPISYQQIEGQKRLVKSRYVLTADNHVGFAVGDYDHSQPLVIDPTLNYSSYLGGSGQESCAAFTGTTNPGCPAIAVDAGLNYYVAGSTNSPTFPGTTATSFQQTLAAGATANVFVSKFDLGNNLLVTTYLGGNGTDTTAGVAADLAGNIYVGGTTTSTNFPTQNGFNAGPTVGGPHVFVSELKPDGSGLLYSTYLAGSGADTASGFAIDGKGAAFVMGITNSVSANPPGAPNFPTTANALQPNPLSTTTPQFFVSKIDTTKAGSSSLTYSTFFGGSNAPSGAIVQGGGIAVDSTGNVYITGGTNYQHTGNTLTDFPILNAGEPCLGQPGVTTACASATAPDAFVAKINPNTSGAASLVYSTYVGGSGTDIGHGIAVDSGSNVYLTGETNSGNAITLIPATTTVFQNTFGGGASDAFLARLNNPAAGATVSVIYFTYLGAGADDVGAAVAADSSGNARVTGWTSGGFPSANVGPFTPGALGGGDAFVARIDTSGSATALNFVSALGGSGLDHGTSIAIDPNFFTYVAGDTVSGNFPTVSPFQAGINGSSDAFISKLQPISDLSLLVTKPTASATSIGVGNPVTFKYTITNVGPDPTGGVTFADNVQATGGNFGSITSSPGTCTSPTGGVAQCAIGTLASGGTATVSVTMTPTGTVSTFQNSGSVSANALFSSDPVLGNNAASVSVPVDDFSVSVTPNTNTVTAGNSATYQVQVAPIPTYPNSVSLSCSSGLPANSRCDFSTTSVTLPSTSPVSSTLTISTGARPVTTTWLHHGSGLVYAVLLPVSGLTLIGAGVSSRRRKWLMGICLLVVLGTIGLSAGCGSSSSTPPTTGGTPAGTYTVTVTGTSGAATRSQNVTLVVN